MMNGLTTLAELSNENAAIAIITSLVVAFVIGWFMRGFLQGASLASAKEQAEQIVDRARIEAETSAKDAELQSEKRIRERLEQADQEISDRKEEIREGEKRLSKREDSLDSRDESLGNRERALEERSQRLDEKERGVEDLTEQARSVLEEQKQKLLSISNLSPDEARSMVLQRVEEDCRLEVAKVSRKITEDAETESRERATEILVNAVQRYAGEIASDSTVRAVPIPSDDMKGRIIGREGRNIRAIEKATGADIIVDDTPGVIVVSCFDKVKQAIAVESLNRLIADGRMHPTRIEEVTEKVRGEIEKQIVKAGKDAALETNLRGLSPKVSEAMGKLSFRTSFGQNVLKHSVEVAFFSQIIADQLGLDGRLARRCGFLHDIGKAMDQDMEGGHPAIGMEFARQNGEKDEAVLNAIGGHHADIPATTFYTPIVMAADALSSARPGARRESMERYVQRLHELQDIALSHDGVTEAHAIQAGREVRVMVEAEKVSDDEAHLIASKIASRVSDEMTFPGEIKVTVLRETRAVELAR